MTRGKRLFDVLISVLLLFVLAPIFLIVCLVLLIAEGRPVFFLSERMKSPDRSFQLIKFRTMSPSLEDSGVTGGDKSDRISRVQGFVRKLRLDEVPQLWNVMRGDMSLVGPRPPLRVYVDDFKEIYEQVLKSRPGITGLATLTFHRHEEKLLARCATREETDQIYRRRCIPRKAKLDLIYQRKASVCFDLVLIGRTIRRVLS